MYVASGVVIIEVQKYIKFRKRETEMMEKGGFSGVGVCYTDMYE